MEGGKGMRMVDRRGGFLATDSVFPCLFVFFPPPVTATIIDCKEPPFFFFSLFSLTSCFPLDGIYTACDCIHVHYISLIFNFWFSIPFFVSDYSSFSFDTFFPLLSIHPPPSLSHHPNRDFLVLKNETRTQ